MVIQITIVYLVIFRVSSRDLRRRIARMRLDALDTVQDEGGAQLPEVIRGPHNMAMRAPLHACMPHRGCDLRRSHFKVGFTL
jgi:hypothetical protein